MKVGDLVRVYRRANARHDGQYVIGVTMAIEEEEGYNTVIDVQLSDGRWCSAALCNVEVLNEAG